MAKYNEEKIIVPRFNESNGFYTTKARSSLMAKIKSKDTKPEVALRHALWHSGLRYRKQSKKLPGNPDIVNKKLKIAIFIDGEFWHGYNWEDKKNKIKTNRDFWIPKIERNMQRDHENSKKLADLGYTVFRFWEHEIKKNLEGCVLMIMNYVKARH
jgi:DNA mismatch endonuclease (patch repair protein)